GYAHNESIIHRDLKPANVMVRDYAELPVMDCGLDKKLSAGSHQLPDADDPLATTSQYSEPSGSEPTRAGSVLGTPAFMAPEQAIGAIDRLDSHSDVFGLGAILCVLLTGKPPFVAPDGESTRQLAARAKLDDAFARLDGCGAEPALVALAKRCLSAEQDQRPRDGGEVAAAIAELRRQAEERARQAEGEKSRAEGRADEQRKRRRGGTAGAAAPVVALLAGVVGRTSGMIRAEKSWEEENKQRGKAETAHERAEEKRKEADAERAKAETARGIADAKRKEADAERGKAEKARDLARERYRLAPDAFNQMGFGI